MATEGPGLVTKIFRAVDCGSVVRFSGGEVKDERSSAVGFILLLNLIGTLIYAAYYCSQNIYGNGLATCYCEFTPTDSPNIGSLALVLANLCPDQIGNAPCQSSCDKERATIKDDPTLPLLHDTCYRRACKRPGVSVDPKNYPQFGPRRCYKSVDPCSPIKDPLSVLGIIGNGFGFVQIFLLFATLIWNQIAPSVLKCMGLTDNV